MPSANYESLRAEVTELGDLLLDFEFNPEGNYSKVALTKTAAYTVFSHAEIEAYFEARAMDLITLSEAMWKENGQSSKTLISVCSFLGDKTNPPQQKPKGDVWKAPVFGCVDRAKSFIKSNNGIRPAHVLPFLALVGFDIRSIDDNLLSELDTLGTIRGYHAHNSLAPQPGQVFDPFDRKNKVEGVIALILPFDEGFDEFKRSQFGPLPIAKVEAVTSPLTRMLKFLKFR